MIIEMLNSKQFEKHYSKYFEGGFQQYVNRIVDKFNQLGKGFQRVELFENDTIILKKKSNQDVIMEFIPAKKWWNFFS
jgi:hypothetical protein